MCIEIITITPKMFLIMILPQRTLKEFERNWAQNNNRSKNEIGLELCHEEIRERGKEKKRGIDVEGALDKTRTNNISEPLQATFDTSDFIVYSWKP